MEKFCKSLLIISLLCLFVLTSCKKGRTYFPGNLQEQQLEVVRFDSAFIHADTTQIRQLLTDWYSRYPDFMPVFAEDILGVDVSDTDYLAQVIPQFLADTLYHFKETNARVDSIFSDFIGIFEPAEKAFARLKYLYPDLQIPKIYTFVSGFNASLFFLPNEDIALGLDMYLGSDYPYYNQVVYRYQMLTMRPECIPVDVVSAVLFRNIPQVSTQGRLIDNMFYRGSVMYLLAQLVPNEPAYEIIGYTKEQWDWAVKYERDIWNLMVSNKVLFETNRLLLSSYLNDGPFCNEISQDCPSRIGTWIGWRIVEKYMNRNKDISMQQLMLINDSELILEESHYRP
ncbi:MAG: hypothetical protein IJ756_05000 [Paludibacteraceae bacterium]|nr:hypothetical protein [Paludibacteraceae bacterium]